MKVIFPIILLIYGQFPNRILTKSSYNLTGNHSKSWSLTLTSPDVKDCTAMAAISSDNVYTFSADGTFEFDNGIITEDPACNDCCTDLVDLVGRWEFINGEAGIRVTILHEKGNASNAQPMVLFDAKINILTEDILTISQTDPATGVVYKFEFKKK